MKLPGETCNINCLYCYEKRKPYPNAVTLKPDTLRKFLALCGNRNLKVELHGGEPLLLKRPKMAELLEEFRRYPGRIWLGIQTNGILLDDEWIHFFLSEWPDIDIGVSLDGDSSINDAFRVDYQNRGTSESVEEALRRLERTDLRVGVIATVTRRSLGRAEELISYFSQFKAIHYLKFGPCLDYNVKTKIFPEANRPSLMTLNPKGVGQPGWATAPLEYADFMIEAFEAWRRGAYENFVIEPLFSLIRKLQGGTPSLCHFSDQKCAYALTLYPDGRIGSCDELRMPDANLADTDALESIEEVLQLQTNQNLAGNLDRLFDKCNSCSYQDRCGGGCLSTRLAYEGTDYDDEYCQHRIKLIDHVEQSIGMVPQN